MTLIPLASDSRIISEKFLLKETQPYIDQLIEIIKADRSAGKYSISHNITLPSNYDHYIRFITEAFTSCGYKVSVSPGYQYDKTIFNLTIEW